MQSVQVRLTSSEKDVIRLSVEKIVQKAGLDWKRISLFGSRTDLNKQGGDIDLYIEIVATDKKSEVDLRTIARELRLELKEHLGEQKIDLMLDDGNVQLGPFGELVKKQKVDLWIKN